MLITMCPVVDRNLELTHCLEFVHQNPTGDFDWFGFRYSDLCFLETPAAAGKMKNNSTRINSYFNDIIKSAVRLSTFFYENFSQFFFFLFSRSSF